MVRFAILLGLALICASSWAIEEAQISAQPLVYAKDGKLEGCGIRLVGVALAANLRTA